MEGCRSRRGPRCRRDRDVMIDLPGRFVAEEFGALGDGVADDWQALADVLAAAGATPVILRPGGVYRVSQSLVIREGGFDTMQPGHPAELRPKDGMGGQYDIIRLVPTLQGRRFVLRDLIIGSGLIGVHGVPGMPRSIQRQSVFERIRVTGCAGAGFKFENLDAIGVVFDRIETENCQGNGIHFRGTATLNGATLRNIRVVGSGLHGILLENLNTQADQPAVHLEGIISEYNLGSGLRLKGIQGTAVSLHLEGNDNDQTGGDNADLVLSSSGGVHSRLSVEGLYCSNPRHPQQWRVMGLGPSKQTLLLTLPTIRGGVVNVKHLNLTVTPEGAVNTVVA